MIKAIASTILIFLSLISCDLQESRADQKEFVKDSIEQEIKKIPENKLTIVVYDGCEYIIYKEDKDANSSFGFMAHKGNCTNPIHKCN
jgi:hypothetical protein